VEEKTPTLAHRATDAIEKRVSTSRGDGCVTTYGDQACGNGEQNSVRDSELPPDYLVQTRLFWQPYSDRTLTREDARDMAHNLIGYFAVLREWIVDERRKGPRGVVAPQEPSARTRRNQRKKPSAKATIST
jgi:hypothetical protein